MEGGWKERESKEERKGRSREEQGRDGGKGREGKEREEKEGGKWRKRKEMREKGRESECRQNWVPYHTILIGIRCTYINMCTCIYNVYLQALYVCSVDFTFHSVIMVPIESLPLRCAALVQHGGGMVRK